MPICGTGCHRRFWASHVLDETHEALAGGSKKEGKKCWDFAVDDEITPPAVLVRKHWTIVDDLDCLPGEKTFDITSWIVNNKIVGGHNLGYVGAKDAAEVGGAVDDELVENDEIVGAVDDEVVAETSSERALNTKIDEEDAKILENDEIVGAVDDEVVENDEIVAAVDDEVVAGCQRDDDEVADEENANFIVAPRYENFV